MNTKKILAAGFGCLLGVSLLVGGKLFGAQPKVLQQVDQEGTIAAIGPGMVQLKTLTGQGWLFRISPQTKIHVKGSADKSFLQPRVVVEFTATVDQKGHATSKVAKLAICNLSPQKLPGLFPEGGTGLISEQPGQPGHPASKKKTKEPAGPTTYHVIGPIMSVKDGQYSVTTPHGTVFFEVEEGAEIKVDLSALIYVRAGDRIVVKGGAYREGMGEAQEIEVELTTPLSAPESGRPKKKIEKKTTEKPEEPASEEKPEKPVPKKSSNKKLAKEATPEKE
ncbi:MAG TPA: hypothetical protein PK777_09705 [Thermoguttaceae bacterium]|nr:hypothetical protein [Thermoguttaceae bacterium]HPP53213.1 hypothetical protein [Thermoguttaceae bacterium]